VIGHAAAGQQFVDPPLSFIYPAQLSCRFCLNSKGSLNDIRKGQISTINI
jgi:hypothetical protein